MAALLPTVLSLSQYPYTDHSLSGIHIFFQPPPLKDIVEQYPFSIVSYKEYLSGATIRSFQNTQYRNTAQRLFMKSEISHYPVIH